MVKFPINKTRYQLLKEKLDTLYAKTKKREQKDTE